MSNATSPEPVRKDQEYDGIHEHDNPQPTWFKLIFLATAVFSVGYWYWFHLGGPGKSIQERYDADLAEYQALRATKEAAEGAAISEDALAMLGADAAAMEKAKLVFVQSCASCHTDNGRGLVGPNLTDDFQIHGATRLDIYNTVKNGVPEKGMISWAPVLPPGDLAAVSAYVATMRHTNVAGGKPPQGDKVSPFGK
jgi:cytochrome c oxidase cbb3-type subunit 3